MFGVIPKTMWSKKTQPDDRNRILLAMRPLVVRGSRTMIIDAGMGDKESEKFHEIYGVERSSRHLDHSLAEAGLAPEDIDIVLATHLHFDHAGGFTVRDASGRARPRFPRAQYVVRRGEWEDAIHPSVRTRASYLLDNYVPLAEAGVLQLVDDDADDHAGREGAADGRPHAASPDGPDRIGRQDRGVRGGSDSDDGASAGCVGDGVRPLSTGYNGREAAVRRRKRSRRRSSCSSSTIQ